MTSTTRRRETTSESSGPILGLNREMPGLLLAYAPQGSVPLDRCAVTAPFVVGRGEIAQLNIVDKNLSKRHYKIAVESGQFFVHDLDSTNGTHVDGLPVNKKAPLRDGSVIRAGEIVAVFLEDASDLLMAPTTERHGIYGRFYAGILHRDLSEAVHSKMHILIAGPSGSGKELAASAIAHLKRERDALFNYVTHNSARYASEEEAAVSIFGVAARVFSSVDARPGAIEEAREGVLFLDEVHNLPVRLQRTLLRVLEDGKFQRIGETQPREAKVFFVFASNEDGDTCGLAHDLYNRLWTVTLPSLKDRLADIPGLFTMFLKSALDERSLSWSKVKPHIGADHMEALCLDGLELNNIRGLKELAARIATRIEVGTEPGAAVNSIFNERFSDNPVLVRNRGDETESAGSTVSHYETHRAAITKAIEDAEGNLSLAERRLRAQDIKCSRRWLRVYAQRWGIRQIK